MMVGELEVSRLQMDSRITKEVIVFQLTIDPSFKDFLLQKLEVQQPVEIAVGDFSCAKLFDSEFSVTYRMLEKGDQLMIVKELKHLPAYDKWII